MQKYKLKFNNQQIFRKIAVTIEEKILLQIPQIIKRSQMTAITENTP